MSEIEVIEQPRRRGRPRKNADPLYAAPGKDRYGTPPEIIDWATDLLGVIDLDPASEESFNRLVGAARYYSVREDGLLQPWSGRVFLNPPGGQKGTVKAWWEKLVKLYLRGDVQSACYVSFTLESFQWSQNTAAPVFAFPTFVHGKRTCYLSPELEAMKSPRQSGALHWLPPLDDLPRAEERFRAACERLKDAGFPGEILI